MRNCPQIQVNGHSSKQLACPLQKMPTPKNKKDSGVVLGGRDERYEISIKKYDLGLYSEPSHDILGSTGEINLGSVD